MGSVLLDPGQMPARLELEVRDEASDGQGGIVAGFSAVTSLWARIEPVSQLKEERADEAVFSVTHRIWVRFRDDLTAGMRFRKGSRIFMLRAFCDPDETRRYLVCRCTEEGR